jgi:hypothetical protein
MNCKKLLLLGIVAFLIPILSGCLTETTYKNSIGSRSDYFSPFAIYRSKNSDNLAVGGTLVKEGQRDGFPAYLIIPRDVLVAAHLQTKGDVSFDEISSLSTKLREKLKVQKYLGADYIKVADVPRNHAGLDVNQRTTLNIQTAKWLPFAFVIDATTFPLEIILVKGMAQGLSQIQ